jgi:predicted transcriptional regulator
MTVKITISLPDYLAEFAKRLASQTKRPRSRVFAELLETKRQEILRDSLIEGYRALADENRRFASEAMPLAAEVWGEADPETREKQ